MHLECVFGHAARSTGDGIQVLPILERGPMICAIRDILSDYCNQFQDDIVLKKWAIDITKASGKQVLAFAILCMSFRLFPSFFFLKCLFPFELP